MQVGSRFKQYYLQKCIVQTDHFAQFEAVKLPHCTVVTLASYQLKDGLSARQHQSLLSELAQLKRIRVPTLVPLEDFGIVQHAQERWVYCVYGGSEQVSLGESLERVQSEVQIARVGLHLSEALGAMHRHGLCYLGINMQRVLFKAHHPMQLLPYCGALERCTFTSRDLGPNLYHSPEQLLGKQIDKRADFYSLGILLRQLLARFKDMQQSPDMHDELNLMRLRAQRPQSPFQNRWSFIDRYMILTLKRKRIRNAQRLQRLLHGVLDDLAGKRYWLKRVKAWSRGLSQYWGRAVGALVIVSLLLALPVIGYQACNSKALADWLIERPSWLQKAPSVHNWASQCTDTLMARLLEPVDESIQAQRYEQAASEHAALSHHAELSQWEAWRTRLEQRRSKLIDVAMLQDCIHCPQMVLIPAGTFWMGTEHAPLVQQPRHQVRIVQPFWMGRYEVTYDQWQLCVKEGGCDKLEKRFDWQRGQKPVTHVSSAQAHDFVHWLSAHTQQSYYLPTEAQWSYAAFADNEYRYDWGDDLGVSHANCAVCGSPWDNKSSADVGSFAANDFGLYDVYGNVWEMVADCWFDNYEGAPTDGSARVKADGCHRTVLRGGSWFHNDLRIARTIDLHSRRFLPNGNRYDNVGFRVVREIESP